jgi:hypothetical protein
MEISHLTEKQRLEAISACERIEALNADIQQRFKNILDILERASKPASPSHCPRCNSPDPKRHPAMQFEGEVQICEHEWHKPR